VPPRITYEDKMKFRRYIRDGAQVREAAERAGVGYTWAREEAARMRPRSSVVEAIPPDDTLSAIHLPNGAPSTLGSEGGGSAADYLLRPLTRAEMSDDALRALDDFGYFRYRLFGRKSSPWQEHAAHLCVEKLSTPQKEYGVVNCPPGTGKSTLFTHDIPAWMSARSRSLRGFIGSSTQVMANSYTGRLRNTFSRTSPFEAQSEQKALGLAVDAQSTLVMDYGQFNPNIPNPIGAPWSRSQFTIAQYGETLIGEKESTWTAFGRDTGFLGWRVNIVVWDDLVVRARLRNPDVIEEDRRWFLDEAITRIEPGGLFILQGQRLSPEDLYKFARDLKGDALLFDEDELFELGIDPGTAADKKFWLVRYKAHYDDMCHSRHRISDPPYDPTLPAEDPNQGCLLDPARLPWRELKEIKQRPASNYEVVYQQGDVNPDEVLVPAYYLDGGEHEGIEYPGCYDRARKIAELPIRKHGDLWLSVITIDPSPTNFWSIQWWLYVEPEDCPRLMGNRYLLDHINMTLGANDILDWSMDKDMWVGLLEEWRIRADSLSCPFKHLIVEKNAAQRFMLQYDWFKRWTSRHSINIVPHETGANKADDEYGVKALRNHYRYGRVRLPGHPSAWVTARPSEHLARTIHGGVQPLVRELTTWPEGTTDDCVMANWFLEWKLPQLVRLYADQPSLTRDMPGWMSENPAQNFLQQATGFGLDIMDELEESFKQGMRRG
jgi:hypothetical protein